MNSVVLFIVNFLLLTGIKVVTAANCGVVPLSVWSSLPSGHVEVLSRPVTLVVVTHTVTPECTTDAECVRLSRNIRNNHIKLGKRDIGLSFLVGGNGKIYEGAGWRVGGHTKGYNDISISLSFIGDFKDKLPTAEALQAAETFLGCAVNHRYLGCEYNVVGHRQISATASPGDALQRYIESWPHWFCACNAL